MKGNRKTSDRHGGLGDLYALHFFRVKFSPRLDWSLDQDFNHWVIYMRYISFVFFLGFTELHHRTK